LDIVAALPYKLTEAGSITTLQVTLPNGDSFTRHIPFPYDTIILLRIDYDERAGLGIVVRGAGGKNYIQVAPALALSQFVTKPLSRDKHTP
jgi:hypothetical protein